jgi:TPR repeat protein
MLRAVSSIFLTGLLITSVAGSPLRAETPQPGSSYPGTDLFQSAWKCDQGIGTPINMPEAIRLYDQAAALGNPLAKARLARIYFSGSGVVKDVAAAERCATGSRTHLFQSLHPARESLKPSFTGRAL